MIGRPRDAAPRGGAAAAALACLLASLAAVAWNAWAGPEWSWDRLQYHLYAGFRLTHDVEGLGFAPAGGQSFLNPIAHLPGWLLSQAGLDEFGVSSVLAAMHGLCIGLVWIAARTLFESSPATRSDANVLASVSAVSAAFTPVFLLEVGTSYADVTTTLPLLAGVAFALQARRSPGIGAAWVLAAGVAMGLASGLKLSNALGAACGALLLLTPRPLVVLVRLPLYVTGGVLGTVLGHGWWGLDLWRRTGNPVYPMFEGWFAPAASQAVPAAVSVPGPGPGFAERLSGAWDMLTGLLRMSGARFTPRNLDEWLSFPLRVADPALPPSGAYIETFQPDPRLLLLAVLAVAALAAGVVRRLRSTGSGTDRMAPVTHGAGGHDGAGIGALAVFWIAWYLVWVHSSSNGRYAIGLLLLASPLMVAAIHALLRARRARGYALLVLVCVQATWALVIAEPRGRDTRVSWSDADLRVEVPPSLAAVPVLHLTGWATSWSFLAPWLAPGSAFANLDQALERDTRGLDRVAARSVIDRWSGPVRVLETVRKKHGDAIVMDDAQRGVLDAWLAAWDLAVDPSDCVPIRLNVVPGAPVMEVTKDDASTTIQAADAVLSCALRPAPDASANARAQAVRHDDLFEALERRCPAELGAPLPTRWLGGQAWRRDHPSRGLRLMIIDGKLKTLDEVGRGGTIGPVDLLRVGIDQFDCASLPPSRARTAGRAFGAGDGAVDFSGATWSRTPD